MMDWRARTSVCRCEKHLNGTFSSWGQKLPTVIWCWVNGKLHPGLNPGVFMQATNSYDLRGCLASTKTSGFGPRVAEILHRRRGSAGTDACCCGPKCRQAPSHPHPHTHTRCTGISWETQFVTMWRAGQKFWGVKWVPFFSLIILCKWYVSYEKKTTSK